MNRTLAVATLAVLASFAGLAAVPGPVAEARVARSWQQPAPIVTLSVQGHDGRALPSVMHGGQTFVAGEQGERYEVRLTNNSADRVEVVLSVDGRDAVSGRMADFRRQRGYVLEPFSSVAIDGFRTSMQTVAAFRFTSPGESFAGRSGTPGNAGVIGVAVFKERGQAIARAPMRKRARSGSGFVPFDADAASGGAGRSAPAAESSSKSASPAPRPGTTRSASRDEGRSMMRPRRQDLGTGFGEERMSSARQVTFVRINADRPDFVTTIQYDSAHALADRGVPIDVQPVFAVQPLPDAWPGAADDRFTRAPPRRF